MTSNRQQFYLLNCGRRISHECLFPNVQFLIANEWVDAAIGKTIEVRNPATDQIMASWPMRVLATFTTHWPWPSKAS